MPAVPSACDVGRPSSFCKSRLKGHLLTEAPLVSPPVPSVAPITRLIFVLLPFLLLAILVPIYLLFRRSVTHLHSAVCPALRRAHMSGVISAFLQLCALGANIVSIYR